MLGSVGPVGLGLMFFVSKHILSWQVAQRPLAGGLRFADIWLGVFTRQGRVYTATSYKRIRIPPSLQKRLLGGSKEMHLRPSYRVRGWSGTFRAPHRMRGLRSNRAFQLLETGGAGAHADGVAPSRDRNLHASVALRTRMPV